MSRINLAAQTALTNTNQLVAVELQFLHLHALSFFFPPDCSLGDVDQWLNDVFNDIPFSLSWCHVWWRLTRH